MKASWKTTVLGVAGLVAAAALAVKAIFSGDADANTINGLWEAMILVFPSLAAIFARDNDVTSEEATGS